MSNQNLKIAEWLNDCTNWMNERMNELTAISSASDLSDTLRRFVPITHWYAERERERDVKEKDAETRLIEIEIEIEI